MYGFWLGFNAVTINNGYQNILQKFLGHQIEVMTSISYSRRNNGYTLNMFSKGLNSTELRLTGWPYLAI